MERKCRKISNIIRIYIDILYHPPLLVFRYYSNSETYMCETRKSIVLWWSSPGEKEKLLAFEKQKKEKHKGLKVCDGTTGEGL